MYVEMVVVIQNKIISMNSLLLCVLLPHLSCERVLTVSLASSCALILRQQQRGSGGSNGPCPLALNFALQERPKQEEQLPLAYNLCKWLRTQVGWPVSPSVEQFAQWPRSLPILCCSGIVLLLRSFCSCHTHHSPYHTACCPTAAVLYTGLHDNSFLL